MVKLNMEIAEKEQRGPDTFLKIRVSECERDGSAASTTVDVTLHDVRCDSIEVEQDGILFHNKMEAPCILQIGAPLSVPIM